MEFLDVVAGVLQVFWGLPRIIRERVSFPVDEIFNALATGPGVKDLLHGILRLSFDLHWQGWSTPRVDRGNVWF